MNNWTPITESMPPEGKVVEVKFSEHAVIENAFHSNFKWYLSLPCVPFRYKPTHWREKEATQGA